MSPLLDQPGPHFTISRVTLVRVDGRIDEAGSARLQRILGDLVDGQGLTEVVVDLSSATDFDAEHVASVLDASKRRLAELGGTLELRLPAEIPEPVAELTTEIPSFTAIETEPG